MNEVKLSGIPSMSVGKIIDTLTKTYTSVIQKNLPVSVVPSVMLWGAPGMGKSQAIRQIARNIEDITHKHAVIKDVRLLLFNPVDLRGIPTVNKDRTLSVWLRPQVFDMDDSKDIINILFLDEITSAPQSVQASAYQITLDRVIGEHKLPDNCIVISAGNRLTDKSVSYKMPKALANRLMHFQVENNFDNWKQWAISKGIHKMVVGFLSFRQNYLMGFDTATDDVAFPTPRSWEMVSNILTDVSDDIDEVYPQVAGLVGVGTALEFKNWSKVYKDLPSIEDIFKGKNPPVPRGTDTLYALSSSITSYAREHKSDLKKISNSIEYVERMPADFSVLIMKDYMYLDKDYKKTLLKIPEFERWLRRKGGLLNGFI